MKKNVNIAIVGLGQIGNYLLNELNNKKKDIELKTGKKIKIVAISHKKQIEEYFLCQDFELHSHIKAKYSSNF